MAAAPVQLDPIVTLLSSLGISGAFAVFAGWATSLYFKSKIEAAVQLDATKTIERLKAELGAANGVQLERLKGELQLASTERSIRLTTVYEKTVDAAAGTYERLLAFYDAARRYTSVFETSDMGSKAERRKKMADKFDQLIEFYRPKKPFLPAETTGTIDGLLAKLRETTVTFMHGVELNRETDLATSLDATKKWQHCHEMMTKEIPPVLTHLEDDLRKLLGIYTDPSKAK